MILKIELLACIMGLQYINCISVYNKPILYEKKHQ